jgi:hypothetical protein
LYLANQQIGGGGIEWIRGRWNSHNIGKQIRGPSHTNGGYWILIVQSTTLRDEGGDGWLERLIIIKCFSDLDQKAE